MVDWNPSATPPPTVPLGGQPQGQQEALGGPGQQEALGGPGQQETLGGPGQQEALGGPGQQEALSVIAASMASIGEQGVVASAPPAPTPAPLLSPLASHQSLKSEASEEVVKFPMELPGLKDWPGTIGSGQSLPIGSGQSLPIGSGQLGTTMSPFDPRFQGEFDVVEETGQHGQPDVEVELVEEKGQQGQHMVFEGGPGSRASLPG